MKWLVRHAVMGVLLICAPAHLAEADPAAPPFSEGPAAPPPGKRPVISPATSPLISVDGACPSLPMITAAVAALVPHGGIDLLPPSGKVEVADLGDGYRVGVLARGVPRARVFQDDTRDCQLRARFAAVFVVLTLLPPGALLEVPPKVPPPPPTAAPPAPATGAAAAPPRRGARLELGAMVDVAPAVLEAPRMIAPGGELRVARPFGRIAGVLGVGFEPRVGFAIAGLTGRQTRVPLDLGVRVERRIGPFRLGGEIGAAGAIFHADGLNTAMPQAGTRLDVGGRAAMFLRCDRCSARVAPFVGLHALLFPWPYAIAISPSGTLGSTPSLWLGATLGIATAL
jgi:hypothetical protein